MTVYEIRLLPTAVKCLEKIDSKVGQRILDKIEWLVYNFDYVRPLPLLGDLSGFYKLRIGNWRVIYEVERDKLEIIIHYIGHRSKIYKIK